jgi:flagellar biosynthesis protein FlhG
MHDPLIPTAPPDQAHGLRRLFAQAGVRLVPVVSNPHMAFSGTLLERLCSALSEQGARTLLVDASENAPPAHELAVIGLADCIEPLSGEVSYLAARTLPLRYADTQGSTAPFLQAVIDAAPQTDIVLVHAGASELSRMFARQTLATQVRPLLLAGDHPASVTHAYAAMKLLAMRARLMVFQLLLGAAPTSPRAERIAAQLALCADTFMGALLHDWAQVDPASHAAEALPPALVRLARTMLLPAPATDARLAAPAIPFDTAVMPGPAWQGSGLVQALN